MAVSMLERIRVALAEAIFEAGFEGPARLLDEGETCVFEVPAYVAGVAGTDHAESAHDALSAAARRALDTGRAQLVLVTPLRRHDEAPVGWTWRPRGAQRVRGGAGELAGRIDRESPVYRSPPRPSPEHVDHHPV